jgi:hypothetical protein
MSLRRIIACIGISMAFVYGLHAQSANNHTPDELREWVQQFKKIEVVSVMDEEESSWTLFEDQIEKSFYIDFDSFNLNLKEVLVKDIRGDVIFRKKVYELPVDAIYEVNFSDYPPGFYTIEVHSFISTFSKSIELF